jgi:hypothetical protein
MAPDKPDHGRVRRGSVLTLYPTVDLGIGLRQQVLERRHVGIVETAKHGVGEPAEHEIHFLGATMMRTIKRAFYPGLWCCHGMICADGLWMSELMNARRWPDDPMP